MAENLKVIHFRNGESIQNVSDSIQWADLNTSGYCNYENNGSNVAIYGRLYNWYAINDIRIIAPEGWHIPSDEEWKELEMYLGMNQYQADDFGWRGTDEGGKLKETGTLHWNNPNNGATNESGFSALPGGYRGDYNLYVGFDDMCYYAYFWTSTEQNSNYALLRSLCYEKQVIFRGYYTKRCGFSVRCVKD